MKRLLTLVAVTFAFAALAAAAARATSWSVSIQATPSTVAPDQTLIVSGVVAGPESVAGLDVELYAYSDEQCTIESPLAVDWENTQWMTGSDGAYSYAVGADGPDTYYVQAVVYPSFESWDVLATSDCTPITFATAPVTPAEPASSFLCWNREMTDPVVYQDAVADQMWQTGNYFEPQALLGNVAGGTNIGAYHLVCNAPSTVVPTGEGLGGSGEVFSLAAMQAYHATHVGGNDLNVYHIYK